jgi:uncharacterized protein
LSRAQKILLSLFVLGLGLLLGASWKVGNEMVWRRTHPAIAAAPAPAEEFFLTTPDGMKIMATYRPGKKPHSPGILILHGIYNSRQQVSENAAWLAARGFAVLTIDFRGHGQSSDAMHTYGLDESIDAQTAFDWLKQRQSGAPVGIIGISLGGAASLLGAKGPVDADALVLQAVFPDIRRAIYNRIQAHLPGTAFGLEPLLSYQALPRFGVWPDRLSPIKALALFKHPVLIIGGEDDRYTPPEETREMFDAAAGPKKILFMAGMNHPQVAAAKSEDYRQTILAFFTSALGAP